MATCKDCLHFKACANMLRAMGYTVDGDGLSPEEYEKFHWNYCPVCGAKMDGGDEHARE